MPTRSTPKKNAPDDPLPKISAPASRALASIGVTKVRHLARHTQRELLALHGFGPKAIAILAKHGIRVKR